MVFFSSEGFSVAYPSVICFNDIDGQLLQHCQLVAELCSGHLERMDYVRYFLGCIELVLVIPKGRCHFGVGIVLLSQPRRKTLREVLGFQV